MHLGPETSVRIWDIKIVVFVYGLYQDSSVRRDVYAHKGLNVRIWLDILCVTSPAAR